MKVFFKFRSEADESARRRVIRQLREQGATRVRRLFPRTDDAGLRDRYVAETPTERRVNALVDFLRGQAAIAFAQHEVVRRPP